MGSSSSSSSSSEEERSEERFGLWCREEDEEAKVAERGEEEERTSVWPVLRWLGRVRSERIAKPAGSPFGGWASPSPADPLLSSPSSLI